MLWHYSLGFVAKILFIFQLVFSQFFENDIKRTYAVARETSSKRLRTIGIILFMTGLVVLYFAHHVRKS